MGLAIYDQTISINNLRTKYDRSTYLLVLEIFVLQNTAFNAVHMNRKEHKIMSKSYQIQCKVNFSYPQKGLLQVNI